MSRSDLNTNGVEVKPVVEKFRCSAHPFYQPDCKHCIAQNTSEDDAGVAPASTASAQTRNSTVGKDRANTGGTP